MELILLRHGETAGNLAGRYVGSTDEPLTGAARRRLREAAAFIKPAAVVASPLQRARETARLLFPERVPEICPDLREMDFGDFEGKTAEEMAGDHRYRRWVEGGCTGTCPGGESLDRFTRRSCAAFDKVLRKHIARSGERLFLVAHGGTIMAIMGRYATPHRPFFEWRVQPCSGYRVRLNPHRWGDSPVLKGCRSWELPDS